ncbi:unnamed protein product [Allacma fusca]|uniref:CASTOR ACT domain-containing protein n=1 Tax=Allacma fusca TaxID=39272 RepID=A0A8J2M8M1_9HEXA|nr:unnamed protein product [Allacma fusca]
MKPFSVANFPLPEKTPEVRAKLKEKAKQLFKGGYLDLPEDVARSKNGKKIKPSKLRRQRCRSSAYHALIRESAMKQYLCQFKSEADAKKVEDEKKSESNFKKFTKNEIEEKISEIKYYVPKKSIEIPKPKCSTYLPCPINPSLPITGTENLSTPLTRLIRISSSGNKYLCTFQNRHYTVTASKKTSTRTIVRIMATGNAASLNLKLILYPDDFTIYQLPRNTVVPSEVLQSPWYTVSRTDEEVSIILPSALTLLQDLKLTGRLSDLKEDEGWICLKLEGVFDFSLVGILTEIVNPLKAAQVPVFVVSTFNTDYIFIKAVNLAKAKNALSEGGITVINKEVSVLTS